MITFVWTLVLLALSFWLDQVFVTEIGEKKHPCFCFGCKKKLSDKSMTNSHVSDEYLDMQPKETDLEAVDEALQGQTKANQTLVVEKLRKVYGNGKVAVGCLDLEMYSNQIFALLGQNGAGKTTTISIISGLLTKTQGSVRILGKNRDTELDGIRKMIGVCPQTNPIYSELTVYEHMELYAKIKGRENGPEIKIEIDTILQNIDLAHKSKYMAGKLSGGQKRKLCVATALVGGSKILLLDEPSSGMDTYARRHLWEMLKEYRKDKLIILSTHYMDEADFLADRIGIMKNGKLLTCGSSLFLKNKFGVGYDLTIIKNEGETPYQPIFDCIQAVIAGAMIIGNSGMELKLRLPIDTLPLFETLFQSMETNMAGLGINNYGISLSSLEQVFINVTNSDGAPADLMKKMTLVEELEMAKNESLPPLINNEKKVRDEPHEAAESIISQDFLRETSSWAIFRMHFWALTKKKIQYFKRDKKAIACELLVPMLCVFFGLTLTLISFIMESPPMDLNASIGGLEVIPYNIYYDALSSSDASSLFTGLASNPNIT
jgi:ATP-binding cassette subfamily A (ABC1) protein 3